VAWLGVVSPLAGPVAVLIFISYGSMMMRLLITKDNFSRIFFCLASVFAFSQLIRMPSFLLMVHGLGWPSAEAVRLTAFIYPIGFIVLSPLLFRYARARFRCILDIVETQKWYTVGLPPLLIAFMGGLPLFPASVGIDAPGILLAVLMPMSIIAYFISMYVFLIHYRDKQLLQQQLNAAGRLEHAYEFYGRELDEKESRLRTMRHDFRHLALHLEALAEDGDVSGLKRELQAIVKTGDAMTVTPFSENRTVNAIVSFHFAVAMQKGVLCKAEAFVPADLPTPEANVSLLLGNALENCVKGAGPLAERGYITFAARPVRGYMLFTFENNYGQGAYATGEKAGLASIRELCERLQGRMEVTDTGNVFTLKAFVPMI
jgi:hypothetical protein